MQQPNDAIMYALVLCLPLVGWIVSRPPVWSRFQVRLEPVGLRLWQQLTEREQPDEQVLRRWAIRRLDGLRDDLDRVGRLIADDDWMTATRQVGNRLAYARLVHDVDEAEVVAAAFGPLATRLPGAAPTPAAAPRLACTAPAPRASVEVMEFGPTGRWF